MLVRYDVPWGLIFTAAEVAHIKEWALQPPNFAKQDDGFTTYSEFIAHLKLWELVPSLVPKAALRGPSIEALGVTPSDLPVVASTPVGQAEVPRPYSVISGALATSAPASRWLHSVDEVQVMEDACTDALHAELRQGWRLLAICPHANQRRPDYVLGRSSALAGSAPPVVECGGSTCLRTRCGARSVGYERKRSDLQVWVPHGPSAWSRDAESSVPAAWRHGTCAHSYTTNYELAPREVEPPVANMILWGRAKDINNELVRLNADGWRAVSLTSTAVGDSTLYVTVLMEKK